MLRFGTLVQVVLLGSAAMAPSVAGARKAPVPVRASAGDITLFQSPRRVLAMVRIGDGDLLPMVFDTGSDGNTIDATLTKRLRLKQTHKVVERDGTTGKTRNLFGVTVPNVTLGGLKIGSIDAVSVDYDRDDAMGIVSPEMFTDSLLYLDLANDRATLVPRATAPLPPGAAIPYVGVLPSVGMVMPDGSTLPAHFDTGFNGALSLPVAMMDTVPLDGPATIVGRFKSINTEGPVYGGRIKGKIRIGPVVLDNPNVTFLGVIANIGLPIIRQVTLVIDPAANRNWVLAPGTRPAPALVK